MCQQRPEGFASRTSRDGTPNPEGVDDHDNNLVAAGAVWGALMPLVGGSALTRCRPVPDEDGNATNAIEVRFSFLQSPYRITVERVRQPGEAKPVSAEGWPTIVALVRRIRSMTHPRDEDVSGRRFAVVIDPADLDLTGVAGLSWERLPHAPEARVLVLEER